MTRFSHIAIATLAFFALASTAEAREIKLKGKHSRAEIASKCDAVGGMKDNTGGKSGSYGCHNLEKNTWVMCSASGKCTGWVPQ